jgi:hypothetical protein
MTARLAPEHDDKGSDRVAAAHRATVLEPDGDARMLDGTLEVSDSGVGIWVSGGSILPVTPSIQPGSYRIAARTRAQPQTDQTGTEAPVPAPRLEALDFVFLYAEGRRPRRWVATVLGGEATAPVWKHFALVDPERIGMSKEGRSSQWLEVMRSPSEDPEELIVPDAGGPPAAFRPMTGASGTISVPRFRVFEFRGATAMPGDVITGADLIGWVGVADDDSPVALALDVGTGMRRRAAEFEDVADAWAEPVGHPIGRPRLGPRVSWRYAYSEQFVRAVDGHRGVGMPATPVRVGSIRFPSGRIALTAASLRESVHVIDLKVPSDREFPCFVSGELHREPSILIRVADGRPSAWHLALGRGGHAGTGTNGTVALVTDAELAQRVVRGQRRPDGNALLRMRLHTPDIHSIARAAGDALSINLTVPTILPIVGVDDEGKVLAVSFLAAQHPHIVAGPREAAEVLDLNDMSRGFSVCVFSNDDGFAASVPIFVPVMPHDHGEEDGDFEMEGTDRDGRPIKGRPDGWQQWRFEVLHEQRDAHDIAAIARVVSMASETGTALRLERYDDGWRWGVVARGGEEAAAVAAARFAGVAQGRLESESFCFTEIEDGWWVLHPYAAPADAPGPEATAVFESDRPIDTDQAALRVRELFAD